MMLSEPGEACLDEVVSRLRCGQWLHEQSQWHGALPQQVMHVWHRAHRAAHVPWRAVACVPHLHKQDDVRQTLGSAAQRHSCLSAWNPEREEHLWGCASGREQQPQVRCYKCTVKTLANSRSAAEERHSAADLRLAGLAGLSMPHKTGCDARRLCTPSQATSCTTGHNLACSRDQVLTTNDAEAGGGGWCLPFTRV